MCEAKSDNEGFSEITSLRDKLGTSLGCQMKDVDEEHKTDYRKRGEKEGFTSI